jgi:thymidylate synthase (FAD)
MYLSRGESLLATWRILMPMNTDRINVLDHGFVRLIDSMGSDLSVVRAARVSYNAAWRAGESEGSDQRLINYLWKNKHTSPFEAVTFTFEVKAPIFIFRQWHRHRTWSYNELSARYQELPEEFYLPDPKMIGVQSTHNKQVRTIAELTAEEELDAQMQVEALRLACVNSFDTYRELLNEGWPRELARSVLPVNTYSHMFASVDLLNLLKFLQLRDHSHAQHEIRVYAQAMKQLIEPIVPACLKAFDENA